MSTLKQCVASCRMDLNLESSIEDLWLEKRANDAMKLFNNPEVRVEEYQEFKLDENGRFPLPECFYQVIAVEIHEKWKDTQSGEEQHRGYPLIYLNSSMCNRFGFNQDQHHNYRGANSYKINGEFFQMNADYHCVDKVHMSYLAYPMEDGQMCVPDSYEQAIAYFLCWRYAIKHHYPAADRNAYKADWIAAFNKCNGDAQMLDWERNKAQIIAIMNSCVNRKNIRRIGI